MMRDIIVATGNSGKLREIREILHDLPYILLSLADRWNPIPSIPETGDTFLANARQKAAWVFERTGNWTIADDSGLEGEALGGAPGVKSARYAGKNGDSQANNEKLLKALSSTPAVRRTAQFRCVVVLMTSFDTFYNAEGVCRGRIINKARGTKGFGYDPLFIPDGFDQTFAELPSRDKHAISHRGQALERLRRYLNGLNG
jgi:XTP/dITP diphosphohydrolase